MTFPVRARARAEKHKFIFCVYLIQRRGLGYLGRDILHPDSSVYVRMMYKNLEKTCEI